MKKEKKFTEDELEFIRLYFTAFIKAFYIQTNTKLTTPEQVLDEIIKGEFTFEDVFMTHIDISLRTVEKEEGEYWDDNMNMFDFENYFPTKAKRVEEGAWIKIRTENGFEVHYAKRSNRKRRFVEELEQVHKKLLSSLKGSAKELETSNKKVSEILTDKVKSTRKSLEDKKIELSLRMDIGLNPYEVKINRTKSQVEYYLPYQYEIVENIEEFSDAYINNVPCVSTKMIFTSQNKDAVFYLQSRGISKKVAEMMATLKQTYFKVNMVEALEIYNKSFRERVQLVTV